MQNFKTLRRSLLGELAMSPERREKKEKKMPFIVATYVYASSQGQRTHSARTNSQIFTPHICTPILGEKYPDYFVLPAPPNYSARTSLEPI